MIFSIQQKTCAKPIVFLMNFIKYNEWMIKKSAYVICYVHKITGGAYKFQNIALKKGCTVINIAEKFE